MWGGEGVGIGVWGVEFEVWVVRFGFGVWGLGFEACG